MDKLSDRQWYVLQQAYRNYQDDTHNGAIVTCHAGDWSIASATCKSLVRLGLLSETGLMDTFHITREGINLAKRGKSTKKLKETDPKTAIEIWNAKVSGK
jgi:hypothetical protein